MEYTLLLSAFLLRVFEVKRPPVSLRACFIATITPTTRYSTSYRRHEVTCHTQHFLARDAFPITALTVACRRHGQSLSGISRRTRMNWEAWSRVTSRNYNPASLSASLSTTNTHHLPQCAVLSSTRGPRPSSSLIFSHDLATLSSIRRLTRASDWIGGVLSTETALV